MDIISLAKEIAESEDACKCCVCQTDEECLTAKCIDKILDFLQKQTE